MASSLERLLRITDKQIADLLARSTKMDAQIRQLQTILGQMQADLRKEHEFMVGATLGGESGVMGTPESIIYDATPYREHMEHRQIQVKSTINECIAALTELRAQLETEHQKQQQYQILLQKRLEEQLFETKKEEQAEIDEYSSRAL